MTEERIAYALESLAHTEEKVLEYIRDRDDRSESHRMEYDAAIIGFWERSEARELAKQETSQTAAAIRELMGTFEESKAYDDAKRVLDAIDRAREIRKADASNVQ